MKIYRDTLSDTEKADLRDYLATYDAERDFLRENPYTPVFGQYTPTLIFTDPDDTAGQPTQTAWDVPAAEPYEPASPFVVVLCGFVLVALPIMAGWALASCLWPWVAGLITSAAGR